MDRNLLNLIVGSNSHNGGSFHSSPSTNDLQSKALAEQPIFYIMKEAVSKLWKAFST